MILCVVNLRLGSLYPMSTVPDALDDLVGRGVDVAGVDDELGRGVPRQHGAQRHPQHALPTAA